MDDHARQSKQQEYLMFALALLQIAGAMLSVFIGFYPLAYGLGLLSAFCFMRSESWCLRRWLYQALQEQADARTPRGHQERDA